MKTLKKTMILTSLISTLPLSAQGIATRLDLPEWTKDMSISAAFVNDHMDFEGSFLQGVDAQGVVIEISNSYNLGNNIWTQSSLRGKTTNSEDEFTDIENQSIGLMQRVSKAFSISDMTIEPSIGAGVNYGGVEYGFIGDSEDQNYISYSGEAKLKLNTNKGIAPYLSYTYEIADLENTSNELDIQSFSAGFSLIF